MERKAAPGGQGGTLGALPLLASRTKPLSAAQKRPAREVQGRGRRGGPCPRRLPPSPTGPQAIRSHLPARALPGRVARRSSGGGRRGNPVPGLVAAPPRAGALHTSLLPAFAHLVDKRGGPGQAGLSHRRGGGGLLPSRPQWSFLRKEKWSFPLSPKNRPSASPKLVASQLGLPFLKVFTIGKACRDRTLPASPSAARPA